MKNLLLIGLIAYGAWYLTKPDKRAYLTEYFNRIGSHAGRYVSAMSDTDVSVLYDLVKSIQQTGGTITDAMNAKIIELANKYGFSLS
jgi:hypothetical protein